MKRANQELLATAIAVYSMVIMAIIAGVLIAP